MGNKLISSTFQNLVTGQVFTVYADESEPTVNPALYDSNGWGIDMKHGCAVACRAVDEYLGVLASGDRFDQSVVDDFDGVLFAVFLPDRVYTEEQRALINRNRQQSSGRYTLSTGYGGRMAFLKFYPHAVRDPATRVVTWGDADPQCLTPVLGFDPNDDYETLADHFIRYLNDEAQKRRYAAGGGPKPSAGGMQG